MSAHDQFTIQLGGGLTWLAKRHDLSCTEVQVVNTLILLDGPDGCHPSFATIAEVSGRPYLMVRKAIKSLKEKRLIDTENRPYRDARGRELKSKSYTYVFAEEIEQALEFAAETIELRRRKTPMPLLPADPDRAPGDLYLDPDRAPEDPYLDPDRAPGDPYLDQAGQPVDPDRAPEDPYLDPSGQSPNPDRAPGDRDLDQIARQGITNRGGGGIKNDLIDQKESLENHHHQRMSQSTKAQELSMQILCHPEIAMPSGEATAFAARYEPRTILDHCMVYRHELESGRVRGIGALIYRLRKGMQPRALTQDESGGALYSEFHNDVVDLELEDEHAANVV